MRHFSIIAIHCASRSGIAPSISLNTLANRRLGVFDLLSNIARVSGVWVTDSCRIAGLSFVYFNPSLVRLRPRLILHQRAPLHSFLQDPQIKQRMIVLSVPGGTPRCENCSPSSPIFVLKDHGNYPRVSGVYTSTRHSHMIDTS